MMKKDYTEREILKKRLRERILEIAPADILQEGAGREYQARIAEAILEVLYDALVEP